MACPRGLSPFKFDAVNPRAVEWAQARSARLVTGIAADARAAIREMVRDAVSDGIAPRDLARLVRDVVGLTPRDALAVARMQGKLLQQGAQPHVAAQAASRYADKLHRRRALTIARTETMAAANEGQVELWRQAQDAGLLPKGMRKVWIVAEPCDLCEPLADETVPVKESFSGGGPPLHPNCRCTVGLVD